MDPIWSPVQGFAALGIVVWVTASALGLGLPLLRILRPYATEEERLPVALALGRWVLMAWAALLAGLSRLDAPGLGIGLGLGLLLLARHLPRRPAALKEALWRALGRPSPSALVAMGAALLPAAILALGPAMHYDALQYQLAVPSRWLAHGGFAAFPHWPSAWLPGGLQLLILYPLAFLPPQAAEVGASLLVFGLGLETILIVNVLLRREAAPTPAWILAAATLVLAPTFLRLSASISSDIAAGWGVALFALFALDPDPAERPRMRVLTLGLALGMAGAIKYTAVLFAGPLWLLIALSPGLRRLPTSQRLAEALGSGLLALLLVSPWMLRAWSQGGHPLAPWFAPLMAGEQGWLNLYGVGQEPLQILWAIHGLFTHGQEQSTTFFQARFSLLPLVFLPMAALVSFRKNTSWMLRIGTASSYLGLFFWAATHQRGSFVLAGWPLIALCCGLTWGQMEARIRMQGGVRMARAFTLLWIIPTYLVSSAALLRDASTVLPALVDGEAREEFRRTRHPEYDAALEVRRRTAGDSRVALVWTHAAWWVGRDVLFAGADDFPYTRRVLSSEMGLGPAASLTRLCRIWSVEGVLIGHPPFDRERFGLGPEDFDRHYREPVETLQAWAKSRGAARPDRAALSAPLVLLLPPGGD